MRSKIETIEDIKNRCRINDDGCWIWQLSVNHEGYALGFYQGKTKAIHRLSAELHLPKTEGKNVVMHKCHVRNCVNPAHLQWGTNTENDSDKMRLNRQHRPIGTKNPMAKLTEANVIAIRHLRAEGAKVSDLALEFRVSKFTVYQAISGKTWTFVGGNT